MHASEVEIINPHISTVLFCPDSHVTAIKNALASEGAVDIAVTSGYSWFRPLPGSHPQSGDIGVLCRVPEKRISAVITQDALPGVIESVQDIHPFDTFVLEVESPYPSLENPVQNRARIEVTIPPDYLEETMSILSELGIGVIGLYDHCYFVHRETGGVIQLETICTVGQVEEAIHTLKTLNPRAHVSSVQLAEALKLHGNSTI